MKYFLAILLSVSSLNAAVRQNEFTTNTAAQAIYILGLSATNLLTAAPTNWPLSAITNAEYLTNWAQINTNAFTSTLPQTNISYTEVTNAPWMIANNNLTNWSQLDTNVLANAGQTNFPYTAITNSPWQYGNNNLTNWSTLNTNVLGLMQTWTNNGTYAWPAGQPEPTTNLPGPAMFIRNDGSMFFGTNANQDTDITDYSHWYMAQISMTDSNEPQQAQVFYGVVNNEDYDNYGSFNMRIWNNGSIPQSSLYIRSEIDNTWGAINLVTSAGVGLGQVGPYVELSNDLGDFVALRQDRQTNYPVIASGINSMSNLFGVYYDGNIGRIRGVAYDWPTSNSFGVLTNDGTGVLSWTTNVGGTSASGTNYWGWNNTDKILTNTSGSVLIAQQNSVTPVNIITNSASPGSDTYGAFIIAPASQSGYPNIIDSGGENFILGGTKNTIGLNGSQSFILGGEGNLIGGGSGMQGNLVAILNSYYCTNVGFPNSFTIASENCQLSTNVYAANNAGFGGFLGAIDCTFNGNGGNDLWFIMGKQNHVLLSTNAEIDSSSGFWIPGGYGNMVTQPNTWTFGTGQTNDVKNTMQFGFNYEPDTSLYLRYSNINNASTFVRINPTNISLHGSMTLKYTNGTASNYVLTDTNGSGIFKPQPLTNIPIASIVSPGSILTNGHINPVTLSAPNTSGQTILKFPNSDGGSFVFANQANVDPGYSTNDVFSLGHNLAAGGKLVATNAAVGWHFENNYRNTIEAYLEVYGRTNNSYRPIFFQWERDGAAINSFNLSGNLSFLTANGVTKIGGADASLNGIYTYGYDMMVKDTSGNNRVLMHPTTGFGDTVTVDTRAGTPYNCGVVMVAPDNQYSFLKFRHNTASAGQWWVGLAAGDNSLTFYDETENKTYGTFSTNGTLRVNNFSTTNGLTSYGDVTISGSSSDLTVGGYTTNTLGISIGTNAAFLNADSFLFTNQTTGSYISGSNGVFRAYGNVQAGSINSDSDIMAAHSLVVGPSTRSIGWTGLTALRSLYNGTLTLVSNSLGGYQTSTTIASNWPTFTITGATNNVGLAFNGNLTATNFILSSVKWDDSPMQFFWGASGPTAPDATAVTNGSAINGMGFTTAGEGTQKVYGSAQIPHRIASSNSTLYTEWHLHVSPTTAYTGGNSNISFTIIYDWNNIGSTNRYGPITNTATIALTAHSFNNLLEFGHISYTNFTPSISAISRCTIMRATPANDYAGTVILDGADVHFPVDKLGSTSDTAP